MIMSNLPEKISLDQLKSIMQGTKSVGLTPVDSSDFADQLKPKIAEMENILREMDAIIGTNILDERWQPFKRGRQQLRVAIRQIKKSISI